MSRSPRKILKQALDRLDEMAALLERYPEARADLAGRLGPTEFEAVMRAHAAVARAVARLDGTEVTPGADRDAP